MLLPYKHILLARQKLDLPLFCENLCSKRWSKESNLTSHPRLAENLELAASPMPKLGPVISKISKKPAGNCSQRRQSAKPVIEELLTLCSQATGEKFEDRLQLLKNLNKLWRLGQSVEIMIKSDSAQKDYDATASDNLEGLSQNVVEETDSVPKSSSSTKMTLSQENEISENLRKNARGAVSEPHNFCSKNITTKEKANKVNINFPY